MGKACCGKAAEGHGCGCGTMNAEFNNEATVQEPDWIPDGDGRAIGQQDFAINLSPLHADTVGTPSPTFNEDITGQDGPSDSPTNSTFEARDMHKAPNNNDVQKARGALIRNGYAKDKSSILYDKYMVNQQYNAKGKKQNRFYYTAVTENDGRYYAMGAHGGIGASHITPYNIYGKKESPRMHFGEAAPALRMVNEKEQAKLNRRPSWKQYRVVTYSELAAESLSEIEGPTAEATTGGLHAPSSFAMTWEDGSGQSSASIPPNEIAWADTKGIPTWVKYGAGIVLLLAGSSFLKAKKSEQKSETVSKRKGCCGGSKKTYQAMNLGGAIAEQQDKEECLANGGDWVQGIRGRHPSYCAYGEDTPPKGAGIQNSLDGGVTFQSEFSVGHINPVEVEGQNDIYGAEEFSSPKVSQPNWGPQKTYRQNARRNLKMW